MTRPSDAPAPAPRGPTRAAARTARGGSHGNGAAVVVGEVCRRADRRRCDSSRSRRPRVGIFSLVVNDVPGQRHLSAAARDLELEVCAARRSSITKPRSARVASSAESITSVSTSSSTRPDPSARSPSRMAAIWAKSLTSDEERDRPDSPSSGQEHHLDAVAVTQPDGVAVAQPVLRNAARRSRRCRSGSPCRAGRTRRLRSSISACSRDTSVLNTWKSAVVRRPIDERGTIHRHGLAR